jgi:acetyltransferase-like isoleucine patch superfamily enzyme
MKGAFKTLARGLAFVLALPSLTSFHVRAWLIGKDKALEGSTQALGLIPGLCGEYVRRAFLSRALAGCDAQAVIGFGTIFSSAAARIDENAYIGPHCNLGFVHVGANALIASGVHIPSGRHTHGIDDLRVPIREQGGTRQLVRIGAGSWIGNNAVVMADVGANAVIGAGAVVTSPIPPNAIAAGVPARVIRMRGDIRDSVLQPA